MAFGTRGSQSEFAERRVGSYATLFYLTLSSQSGVRVIASLAQLSAASRES